MSDGNYGLPSEWRLVKCFGVAGLCLLTLQAAVFAVALPIVSHDGNIALLPSAILIGQAWLSTLPTIYCAMRWTYGE